MRRTGLLGASVGSLGWVTSCLLGCGGGQTSTGLFGKSWYDDEGKSIEAVRVKLEHVAIAPGADVAVGVAGHSGKLIGQPLFQVGQGSGHARWTYEHPLDARPIVVGGVVVATGTGELFALDAMTGKHLWSRQIGGLSLHGAGDDGSITVVTMSSAVAPATGSTLLAIGRDGSVLRQVEPNVALGSPAVVAGLAFVPWDNQYVSVFDISDGAEAARLLLREKTTHAWASGGSLYFGELGMFRFDDKIKDASMGHAHHLALPHRTLPGQPLLMQPGNEAAKTAAGAADKIRLYARPSSPQAPGDKLALDSGRFYATYFRLAFGFSADQAHVAWVHTHPVDLIGGAAAKGSLVLCDADGKLTVLDAGRGAEVAAPPSLGEPVESCVVSADGFAAPGSGESPASPPLVSPLVEQIRRALSDRDLELAAGQALLLQELGALPDETGTGTELLVEMAMDARTLPAVRDDVRGALASRRTGARYLIAALEKHQDFLHDVAAPPVGPIAIALAAMNETRAAPVLAAHLLDPADGDKDVRDVAQALAKLAGPAEVPALLHFFSLYRDAPGEPEEIPEAASATGEALLRLGGKVGRSVLASAVAHAGTNVTVRARIQALLDAADVTPFTSPATPRRPAH